MSHHFTAGSLFAANGMTCACLHRSQYWVACPRGRLKCWLPLIQVQHFLRYVDPLLNNEGLFEKNLIQLFPTNSVGAFLLLKTPEGFQTFGTWISAKQIADLGKVVSLVHFGDATQDRARLGSIGVGYYSCEKYFMRHCDLAFACCR